MWKDLTKEIRKNIFLHASDTKIIYHPNIIAAGVKTRPTDEEGVYKTNKMYQMRIGDIKPLLLEWLKQSKTNRIVSTNLPDALGINDRMVFFGTDNITNYIIYNNGYYYSDKGWGSKWEDKNDDDYIEFALFSEMKEVEKNAKEKARIEAKQLSQRKIKFNTLMFKDNIIAAFKKEGFNLISYDAGKRFKINSEYNTATGYHEDLGAYNRFIEKAIDYYINNAIVNELGCKIHVPKPDNKKGIRYYYDDIIDIENIDIEGE